MNTGGIAEKNRQILRMVKGRRRERARADILFSARPNLFLQPGGDTEVAINLRRVLTAQGFEIGFQPRPQPETDCSLIHLFNCDDPLAIQASLMKKPFLVTPMYEDFDRYYLRSMRVVSYFRDFLATGDREVLDSRLTCLHPRATQGISFGGSFALAHALAVCATGSAEAAKIRERAHGEGSVEIVRVGFNRPQDDTTTSADMFVREYGVRDFVLCVGRLESRKNQLMLLYSLQDEDIPLVFVNSGTVQPEYEKLCREFPRRGKTIFTGRISRELLHSAYRAARVHALPSWYELPGLVSLEAAWFGCNVVASDWGTLRDYLGEVAYYCEPQDPRSIRKAVLDAHRAPRNRDARALLANCSWEEEGRKLSEIYRRLKAERTSKRAAENLKLAYQNARAEVSYRQRQCDALQALDGDLGQGVPLLDLLIGERPEDWQNYLSRGQANLQLQGYDAAAEDLTMAVKLNPGGFEPAHLYLSLALMQQGDFDEARSVLLDALEVFPFMQSGVREIVLDYLGRCDARGLAKGLEARAGLKGGWHEL